jgi:hypothetical protein
MIVCLHAPRPVNHIVMARRRRTAASRTHAGTLAAHARLGERERERVAASEGDSGAVAKMSTSDLSAARALLLAPCCYLVATVVALAVTVAADGCEPSRITASDNAGCGRWFPRFHPKNAKPLAHNNDAK